jgi:Xaa-Pro aminopeptidase
LPDIVWRVPADFPLREARVLEKAGVELECVDGPFFPERRNKSEEEISKIIQGQRLAEKAMAVAVEMLESAKIADDGSLSLEGTPLTSEMIRFEMELEVSRNGGRAVDTIVSCGVHASEPHNQGAGTLRSGETIVIDVFPKGADGYHGDLTRTFVVGEPPEIVVAAYEAVRKARDESKKLLKSGAIPSEAHARAAGILRSAGFETTKNNGRNVGFIHGLGHGVGLDIHEAPSISPRNSRPLEVGDVVTVEPGLYYPEWGGVRLEDVVVIRENGCETLTDCPTRLRLKR